MAAEGNAAYAVAVKPECTSYFGTVPKPLIRVSDAGATIYGTPWDGKHRLSANIAVPLKARFDAPQGVIEADAAKVLTELRKIGALDE